MQLPTASRHRTCLELRCAASEGRQPPHARERGGSWGAGGGGVMHLRSHHRASAPANAGSVGDSGKERTMSARPDRASASASECAQEQVRGAAARARTSISAIRARAQQRPHLVHDFPREERRVHLAGSLQRRQCGCAREGVGVDKAAAERRPQLHERGQALVCVRVNVMR